VIKNPLVSIIIPAYNAEKYIKGAIESALAQTYKNIEIVVVDDGSTDKTKDIVKEFADKRIKYIYQKNSGVAITRNTGIKNSTGEYIAFLDADDYYFPKKIEEEIKFLEQNKKFDLVYCNMVHFYDNAPNKYFTHKGYFPSGNVFGDLLNGFFGQLNAVLIPKKIFNKVGLFDANLHYSEDWNLCLQIARFGFSFGFLNKRLVKIRISSDSHSRMENQWKMKNNNLMIFERLFDSMTEKEKRVYGAEKIIAKLKIKLAIAHLTAKQKRKSIEIIRSISADNLKILFIKIFLISIIKIIPRNILKFSIVGAWQYKHKKIFKKINE
jgi:glycosyltransferase involved in cell wall biosynthesis